MDVNVVPTSEIQNSIRWQDKNAHGVGMVKMTQETGNWHRMEMTAMAQNSSGDDIYGQLAVSIKLDGSIRTSCPHPASNSNDASIATTAWVKSKMLDFIYPVGSIYMSVNEVSPQTFLGGTWVALQDRFLIGAGHSYAVNATGGATTHTLSVEEMPSHSHTFAGSSIAAHNHIFRLSGDNRVKVNQNVIEAGDNIINFNSYVTRLWYGDAKTEFTSASSTSGSMAASGGGKAHSIMNPYLAVYMWKRTA